MASTKDENQNVEVDDIREIFRHVAPYIIRQWKEVCRTLGIQELELAQLEVHGYRQSKAYLAFNGLCLWYDRVGKSASKDKLVCALRHCDLHRAEEEIERLELKKLKFGQSLVRPSSSRHASASKRRPGTGHKELNGSTSRPPSRTGSGSNSKRITSSKSHRQSHSQMSVNACELSVKISVTHVDPVKEVIVGWREKFHEMAEAFYEAVLVNPEIHIKTLENAVNIREITVSDIRIGSLLVRFKILTLGALESLNQMYKTRRLLAICQDVFITENALKTIGAKNIGIKVELSTELLDKCRELFLSRKFKDCVHPTDTLAPPSFETQPGMESPSAEDTNGDICSEKWRNRVTEDVQKIQERSENFDETMEEFIRTLNIIMQQGQDQIQSLEELLELFSYVSKTCAVSSGVRVDLLREFLMIVNSIRLTVNEIKMKVKTKLQSEVTPLDTDIDEFSFVKCLLDDLEHMLEPETQFEEDLSVLNRKLSPSEKPLSSLICFIPLLLAKLSTVLSTLAPSVFGQIPE